ncbi:hypothetical protein F2Q70_00031127 [Brassica cretica]|uniref:No apical meristem-associated C-terminal domain-containing protein n=1 Tax=Brassica cretica TaxID=69181 RepID=A0A8S9FCT9_BRACR|nr:hypothetical protein F2Q70_00031127 [Brassica cretica]
MRCWCRRNISSPGVKAAKARGKKPQVEGQYVSDYQLMWSIEKDDLAMKQQLSKMKLLEKLLAKENLADYEEDRKKKLINELIYLLMWTILLFVSGNGKEDSTLERSITGHCDYKMAGSSVLKQGSFDRGKRSIKGASSQVNECDAGVEGTSRPPGVKAAKAHGKKPQVEGQDVSDYQLMWSIKKDDLAMKQQLSKMRLLEKLLAKENLADYEEDLKKKLINELILCHVTGKKRLHWRGASQAIVIISNENNAVVDDDGTCRPPGVRAAKARGKKPVIESKGLSDFQTMWSIKKEDLAMKEKLSKMKLRESLIAKQVPLADYEEALKKKLINELM